MALVAVFVAYPLVDAMWLSLHRFRLTEGAARFLGLGNYVKAFTDPTALNALRVTVVFVVFSVASSIVTGLALALVFWRSRIVGERVFQVVFMLPMVVTPVIVGLTWKWILDPTFGVLGYYLSRLGVESPNWLGSPSLALPTVIAVDVWQYTPFVFLSLLAGLRSLPLEPMESARIDGANAVQTFRFVVLPMLSPVLIIVVLFRLFMALRTFDVLFILTSGGPGRATQVLNLYIYQVGLQFFDMGYASTLAVILFLLTLPIIIGFVRWNRVR